MSDALTKDGVIAIFTIIALLVVGIVIAIKTESVFAVAPSDYGLKEGDTINAVGSSDPDVYIVNDWGYKRLFLNPVIFGFYGQLGGFANIKNISPTARDAFVTSGLFRNCETNDPKVYGIEATGEDTGTLHWVNTTGTQAVTDDPNFFKKVFCINSNEFNWYTRGSNFNSVNQIPEYRRLTSTPAPVLPTYCTVDAKLCPNGKTYVSRVLPNCEFAACPVPTPTPTPIFTPAPTPSLTSTPTPILASPTNPTASCSSSGTTVTLSWNTSSGVTSYALRADNQADGWTGSCSSSAGDFCVNTTSATYSFSPRSGATYKWWVHAVNTGGWSTQINGPNFTCTVPTPTPTPTPSLTPTPTSTPISTPTLTQTPTPTPSSIIGLTSSQSDIIKRDLQTIKSLGFKRIRIITYVRYPQDPAYTTWPANVFITFPKPTDNELTNLKQYLQLIDQTGLRYEFVLLMPDSKNKYYSNNITGQDYKNFVDAIWPVMWTGKLDSIEVGGDLSLNPSSIDTQNPDSFPTGQNVVSAHRQWLTEMWPYLNNKCSGCNLGLELLTGYAKFWDTGAGSLAWVKTNLTPQPKFVGVQYYPTTPDALARLGFKQGSVINWNAGINDWYENLKNAAGNIPIIADEIGLDLNLGFTQQDQADFYKATTAYLVRNGVHFNVWEFADHPGIGLLGLMDVNRVLKPSATAIQNILTPTLSTAFTAGIQYTPPESVGWQFIMPQN